MTNREILEKIKTLSNQEKRLGTIWRKETTPFWRKHRLSE